MAQDPEQAADSTGHGFGTAPVFLASISTILGAVLFLRFGYSVAHVGVTGSVLIVLIGHLVTIPTALAIAEIATNRRVEGGGEYFIISRSFGKTIGGSIGTALFLSQAVSVAFYMIALAEAFRPLAPWFESVTPFLFDPRMISVPGVICLAILVLTRGADLGVKALWVVVGALAVSLAFFFLGSPLPGSQESGMFETVVDPDPFILVFAIVFPAFTGMTAGVGLSGDLKNPRKSIPLGIISATVVGLVVYGAAILKLATSATPDQLAGDQLIMSRIAIWGPIVPIGLACATISSALGSILVAPRTLQALAADGLIPNEKVNAALARGEGAVNEPRNATIITAAMALATVAVGNVDFVARIISMFFMVTYGALCAISFLEHFAARPSYRPSFRSKWYLSLLGAVMSFILMLQMDPFYALASILVMMLIYRGIRATKGGADDIASIFQGVMTQMTRYFQIKLQHSRTGVLADEWRPAIIMVNGNTFSRTSPLRLCTWLCQRYGFGTYLHFIEGPLDEQTYRESRRTLRRLIEQSTDWGSAVYVDTMISHSIEAALIPSLQVPGISGMENNTVMFELSDQEEDRVVNDVANGCLVAAAARMNTLVLRHGTRFFGSRSRIHIWLTWHDEKNANLMIILAYILLGHRDWDDAEIRIFAALPSDEAQEQKTKLRDMIMSGRLPISDKNVRIISTEDNVDFEKMVELRSANADLVIFGFTGERVAERGASLFRRHPTLSDVLWVSAEQRILIE